MKQSAFLFSGLMLLAVISVACASATLPSVPPQPPVIAPPTQVATAVAPQPLPTATTQPLVIVPPTQVATAVATQPLPTSIPTVVVSQPATNPASSSKRIAFPPGGTSATLQGSLSPNGMDNYILRALAGQTMIVNVSSSKTPLLLQIAGVDGNPLKTFGAGSSNWSGILPTTQDYVIGIIAENASAATYTLHVTIPPLATLTPGNGQPKRIAFPPGGTSATLEGNLVPNGIDNYILRALAGQTMTVNAFSKQTNLLLEISGADGQPLKTFGAGSSDWSGVLPKTQDYVIKIASENSNAAIYTLLVTIPPIATPTGSQPKRIQFAQGATSAIIHGNLTLNAMDVYVLRALAGQTMSVSVSSPTHILLAISGADGDVLKSSGVGTANWSGRLRKTQDYFIKINTEDGEPASYTLQVTILPLTP